MKPIIKTDCRYFKGDRPCIYHKERGVHCNRCKFYSPISEKILIIKLGAMGDVIRTTPILHKLKEIYPRSEITWLTYHPEVIPSIVDRVLYFGERTILYLLIEHFDILLNFDKDLEAISLTKLIKSDTKKGFTINKGKCIPADSMARHKYLTGVFDDINRKNTKSYPEEIFEMCGFRFNKEKYILEIKENFKWNVDFKRPLIGLNIGCGKRWTTRLWSLENWVKLAIILRKLGFGILLLGGEAEDKENKVISKRARVTYLGHFPIKQFFSLLNQCDLVITSVTSALHAAIALKKKIVLLNNIFNKNEFELYGLGKIIEPDLDCVGCFKNQFDSSCKVKNCMDLITPQNVLKMTLQLL